MKTKSGIDLVKKFRELAADTGQSMFIGRIHNDVYGPIRMGIWLYKPGTPTRAKPPVAEAASLDELHGR